MSIALSILRARLEKYRQPGQAAHYGGPVATDIMLYEVCRLAGIFTNWIRPLVQARYDEVRLTRKQIAELTSVLDRIESGQIKRVGRQLVDVGVADRRPDSVHSVKFLNTGRPVIVLGRNPHQSDRLVNPFRRPK